MRSYRKRKSSRKSRKSSRKNRKVSFVTADGKHVSFSPKKRRKGAVPAHLKVYTNKMKMLGKKYQNGDFGDMEWVSVVEKYMSNKRSSKRKSRRRSRR